MTGLPSPAPWGTLGSRCSSRLGSPMVKFTRGLAVLTAAGLMSAGLVAVTATSSSADHEGARFSETNPTVTEGQVRTITVVRSDPSSTGTITVAYATSDTASATTTATVGQDYQSASGTVTILAGQPSGTFTVTTLDDATVEPSETVELVLGDPTTSTPGDRAVLTILDNDTPAGGGGGGGGGGGTTPTPSASASASASASPSATATVSPSATA